MAYRQVARRKARKYGLDPGVFIRQIEAESGFNPNAVSPAGAVGIAQIMPATARGWGVDPRNPRQALDAAARNMAQYVRKYGSYENALRAYNAGPGAIEASKGYAETNAYVQRILRGSDPKGLNPRSGAAGGSGGADGNLSLPGTDPPRNLPQGSEGLVSLLASLQQQKPQISSAGVASPEFSAAAALPAGYQGVSSGGGPAPKPDISGLLDAVKTLGGDIARQGTDPASVNLGGTGGTSGAVRGATTKRLTDNLQAWAAQELGIQGGSRERSAAENARVGGSATSDHLTGSGREAVDLPTTAAQGGWDQYRKVVRQLGLTPDKGGFTQGTIKRGSKRFRVQVIFGDAHGHGDHIHVGLKRV